MIPDGHYLWIATENGGLSRMDVTDGRTDQFFIRQSPIPIPLSIILSGQFTKIGKAGSGRVPSPKDYAYWMCWKIKFPIYDPSLESDLVNVIFLDSKNRMWIGTEDGLVLKDHIGLTSLSVRSKK